MMKKFAFFMLIVIMLAIFAGCALSEADPMFAKASISLSSSMTATFSAMTKQLTTISVSSCSLQHKVDGIWKKAWDLSAPGSTSNTLSYNKTMGYSSDCQKGVTYRVTATFSAGGESVTRTSNEITY